VSKRLIVSDTTVEALAIVIQQNPRGVIFLRDELAGWLNSMNQYKSKGADEQFYLSAWSGGNCYTDRKNLENGPIIIPDCYLAVCGTVQPSVLGRLLTQERHEEGFASRLLIVYPEEKARRWNDYGTDKNLMKPIKSLFSDLVELKLDEDQPVVMNFTPKGWEAFSEVMEDHLSQGRKYLFNDNIAAYWAKMEGYAGRLCLIIHLARLHSGETSCEQVDPESVYMAATLIDYFKAHIVKFDRSVIKNEKSSLSDRALAWAQKHGLKEIECRLFLTSKMVENVQKAVDLFQFMVKQGIGYWKDTKKKVNVQAKSIESSAGFINDGTGRPFKWQ